MNLQPLTTRPAMKAFVLDVDGVLTNGQFLYSVRGKEYKIFGPDDNDGLSLLREHLDIRFVTGDKKGYEISRRRIVEDMDFPLDLVSTVRRVEWVAARYPLDQVIYMGDGIFDHYVMKRVGYAIAPHNADRIAKASAHYVTERSGGDRAVAEAALHVLERFFTAYDPEQPPMVAGKLSGQWTA